MEVKFFYYTVLIKHYILYLYSIDIMCDKCHTDKEKKERDRYCRKREMHNHKSCTGLRSEDYLSLRPPSYATKLNFSKNILFFNYSY